jgi:amino acid transporter
LPRAETGVWLTRTEHIDWALLFSTLLWNTSGWDNAGCCAGEVKKPELSYPRAMAVTVVLVTVVYLLPIAVGTSAATDWSAWKEGYFPKVAAQIGGSWLATWITLAGLVSAAGMLNALLCTSARVPFAMAERRMLPQPLATLHLRYATPWVSILVNSTGIAVLIPFSFQELIEVDMFLYAAALILEFAALVWLRIKRPEMVRPYRVPFGTPGAIAISISPVLLCIISIAISNDATKYVSLGGIAVGCLIYYLQTKPTAETETEPKPAL